MQEPRANRRHQTKIDGDDGSSSRNVIRCYGCGKLGVVRSKCDICNSDSSKKTSDFNIVVVEDVSTSLLVDNNKNNRSDVDFKSRVAYSKPDVKCDIDVGIGSDAESFYDKEVGLITFLNPKMISFIPTQVQSRTKARILL